MKIIITTESYPPAISGVAVLAKDYAQWAISAGFEVLILTVGTGRDLSVRSEKIENKNQKKARVFYVPSITNPWRRQNQMAWPWFSRNKIKKIIADFKPDLIHLQDPGLLSRAIVPIANDLDIPVIIHHHFSEALLKSYLKSLGPLKDFVFNFVRRGFVRLYNRANLVLTPSEFSKKQISVWGFKTPIEVLSNSIDFERFSECQKNPSTLTKYNIDSKLPIVLYLGRIDQDKNCRTLIEAIKIIEKKSLKKIQFVFVGDGNDRKNIEKTSDAIFTGSINHDNPDIPILYKSADIFWSASPIETFGIVTLEAMASGTPVVVANAGATPELVDSGQNGELCQPNDPQCFAKKVLELIDDKERQRRYSQNGLKKAKEFGQEKIKKRLLTIYRSFKKN